MRKKIGKIIIHYDPTERRVIGTAVANFTASKVKSFTNTCLSGVNELKTCLNLPLKDLMYRVLWVFLLQL